MERITPEIVVAAYQETGLKPEQNLFTGDGCACALGAIYTQRKQAGEEIGMESIPSYFIHRIGHNYMMGFMRGFDGEDPRLCADQQAYEDGKKAWEAVVEAGLA